MIEINNVSKTFREGIGRKKVQALNDLSLSVAPGEVFGFLGPNGAGKSTTIKILFDLIRPDSGTVSLCGGKTSDPAIRNRVGYLPENPYFYDYLTARELLWFGGKTSGVPNEIIRERTETLLSQVDLSDAGGRRLRTYSKGMVQRAGLALSMIHDPELVILDEPMSGLDPIGRRMVVDLIVDLKNQGKTVFFSSHILADIERLCDRVAIMHKGRLQLVGSLEELPGGADGLEELFINTVTKAEGEGAS